jgi:hypothetical protein
LGLLGSGKRGRPAGQASEGKDEIMLQVNEEIEGAKLKLQQNIPNVMADTLAEINRFGAAMLANPDHFKELLVGLPDDELNKLHAASLTRNMVHKSTSLAKVMFKNLYTNAGLLKSRSTLCESTLQNLMLQTFTDKYWKDGSYAHSAFTEDIIAAMKEQNRKAGRNEAEADAEM